MGVTSVQGFKFKLVANGEILDLYADEEIKISDNITGLFDLGLLPADFTRTITLPGSKKNNHFFEFVYDISVENPYTFATNLKVPCYMDFDGIYLTNGYIQLNKVNVYQNKYIDSYEVTIYGGLASFGRDLKRFFLTDLTGSLSKYNHTASYQNISASWGGNLFSGSIVYPMAEYGEKLVYTNNISAPGINTGQGAMCVQDFKPAIRMINVWDAIFEQFGYTYSSSFLAEPWIQDVYLLCNNQYRYPIFNSASNGTSSIDLETYGQFRMDAFVTSSTPSYPGTYYDLPFYNITRNPSGILSSSLEFQLNFNSNLRGEINLNFELAPSGTAYTGYGYGVPQFSVVTQAYTTGTWVDWNRTPLNGINQYMSQVNAYNSGSTKVQSFELLDTFNQTLGSGSFAVNGLPANTPLRFRLAIDTLNTGINHFTVTFDKSQAKSYLDITKVNQGGDGLIMDIPSNMPQGPGNTSGGQNGIKLIDFISSIQKKFNLIIYPNKTKLNEFIVEPFNKWYKSGRIKDFNRYINLNDLIGVTPANNLAVSNLSFGDTLDGDYISQQFAKGSGREYGKASYIDTQNYYSQGTFEVKTGFASSPLIYLSATGVSGSGTAVSSSCPTCNGVISNPYCYQINYGGEGPASASVAYYIGCDGSASAAYMGGGVTNKWICAQYDTVTLAGSQISWTLLEPCKTGSSSSGSTTTEKINKINIPTFISSITYQPVKVLPHIYFYNGMLASDNWYFEGTFSTGSLIAPVVQTHFPYFDNYNVFGGSNIVPTANNLSLLFNNEQASYGVTPTESLYSTYWSTYVDLLYNPKTRLIDCAAIIPLADYFKMNLNDIVEWRGNYYHLRAINDYNLKNGECKLQLLGPVIGDAIANQLPISCNFDFDITDTPSTRVWDLVGCNGEPYFYGVQFNTTSSLSQGQVITWGSPEPLSDCYTLYSSSAAPDLTGSIIYSISDNCIDCNKQFVWDLVKCDGSASFYGVTFNTTASLFDGEVVQWGSPALLDGCYTLHSSSAAPDLTGSIIYNIVPTCADCPIIPTLYYYNLQQIDFNCGGGVGHCTGFIGGNFIGYSSVPLVVGDYYNQFGGQVWCVTGTTTPQTFDYDVTSWAGSNYANCGDAAQC